MNVREIPSYKCKRCLGEACPIDVRPCKEVVLAGVTLEVVNSFVYLGDGICTGGGCELATVIRVRSAWGKFRELLPLLTSKVISLHTRGKLYNSCVRSTMIYGSECWALRSEDFKRLLHNERAMLLWMYHVKRGTRVNTTVLLELLNLKPLDSVLRCNRLRWFGHVKQSDLWINKCTSLEVQKSKSRGRPGKTWKESVVDDLAGDHVKWRSLLKAASHTHV